MAEGGEKFQSQQKEGGFRKGEKTPRVVEGSIVRPAGHTTRVVEGGRQLVPQQGGGQESNWFEMPYEMLVGHIDHFVERARARHPTTAADPTNAEDPFSYQDPFNAAEWLGWKLQSMSQQEGEHQEQYANLWRAWEALAYTHYTSKEGGIPSKNLARGDVKLYVMTTKKTSLTLSPPEVTVLDAMAEVAGIPRRRGEATIDLTPFAPKDTGQQP